MSERALKQLVGALAVVVGLWVVASLFSGGGGGAIGASGEIVTFFDGVEESTISAVRLSDSEGDIELLPDGDMWSVNGWRSDSSVVARFFDALTEVTVGDLAATNPANHDRMGVSVDSAGTLEIDADGSVRILLVGNQGPRFSTAYGRLPGEDEVYLLEGNIRSQLTRQLDSWRDRKMVAIDSSRVTRIEVERDGEAFTLVRGDSVWTFEDGSEATPGQVRSILSELSGGLVASRFVAEEDSLAALERGGSTAAYSDLGEVLAEVTVGSGDGDRWATVTGDSVLYRLPSFRVDLITPTLESVRPASEN